jgi:DNA-binding CsgD family transcriptional regulator/DNA-binding transcriptional ArsR family regulator
VDVWPLVGRNRELAQLSAAVIARRGAVITGPAGVGKTTLATVCLQVALDRGMSLTRTTATRASQGLPFGAFASILPPDPGDDILGWEDQGSLLRRYSRSVVRGAEGHPLVVFIDDAHLLDDGSATLVHQLALTQAATVLATVRLGESAPDPVVALWKDGPAERIQVGVLADAAIEELVVTVLRGQVDAVSLRELVDHSQGNPLFLRELVTGALENGALVEEGGFWRLRGALQPTGRLVELVALRLGNLSEPERAVLELLTLGEPLGQATLAQLADPMVVDILEDKGLITSRVDGRRVQVRLAHPVYGDVVRVDISAIRERALARFLAEVIEATGGRRREDTLLLASLRLVGGGGSAELFVSGAMAARARHDYFLAERLSRAAIEEGAGFEARFMAAEAAHVQGRHDQSERELADLAVQTTSDAERARVALLRFDNAYRLQGREADLRLIDDAVDAITDPSWRDELLTRRAMVRIMGSGPRVGVEVGSTLLERPGSWPLTAAHVSVSHSLVRMGRLEDAIKLLTPPPGSQEIPATHEPWDQWSLFDVRTLALVYAGRLGDAEELLTRAYDQVIAEPMAEARAQVTHRLAVLHLEQGRLQRAIYRATESYTHFHQLGRTFLSGRPYVVAAQALALAGQADRAAEILATHDALGFPTILNMETDLLQARAWTAAAASDIRAARAQLEAAADLGEEIGDLIGATSALHGLARLGRARHVAARLAALAEDVDGDLVAGRAAYANAVAARDAEALDRVSQDFEDMGAILYAAEARAEAAVLLRRAGKARQGAEAEQKAARLLARCEGAATPPVQSITAQVRLSPGELDTALQAAAGRTNRQIASDMNLSVRTVENHLQRVYEKLGVSGRHELADAMLPSQPPDPRSRS